MNAEQDAAIELALPEFEDICFRYPSDSASDQAERKSWRDSTAHKLLTTHPMFVNAIVAGDEKRTPKAWISVRFVLTIDLVTDSHLPAHR
jgi:hypothetical protein